MANKPDVTTVGEVVLLIEREDKLILKMTQSLSEVYLEGGKIGEILTGFPAPLHLEFRREGYPNHTVNLRPMLDEVMEKIGWVPAPIKS